MATWRMQRRLFSLFTSTTTSSRQPHISLHNDPTTNFLPSLNSFILGDQFNRKQFRSYSGPTNQTLENTVEVEEEHEASSSSNSMEKSTTKVRFSAKSELKISPRHDLAIMFTWKVCETRSVKTISRESYEKGVVVAICGGYDNYHLIADHLRIFGEKGSIEDTLAARGDEVRRGNSDTSNLTLEDLVGISKSSN